MMVSTTPISIMPTWTRTTGSARRTMARRSPRRGSSRPAEKKAPIDQPRKVGPGGASPADGRASSRSAKSSRSASSAIWVRSSSSSSRTSDGRGPPERGSSGSHRRDPPALGIGKGPAGHEDQVVEVPDPQAAQAGEHQQAGAGLSDVEPVGAERAQNRCQRQGHAAGLVGGPAPGERILMHAGNIPGSAPGVHGHVLGGAGRPILGAEPLQEGAHDDAQTAGGRSAPCATRM